jgi:long-chain fatty acid transport protein
MGGASIAFAEDGFGAASNPANLAQVKDGYSIGVSAFAPDRSVNGAGAIGTANTWANNANLSGTADHDGNQAADAFAIPEFAYSKTYTDKINLGVVVYGNGGMNVDYGKPMYDSGANTMSNLEQLFIAPTISYKLNDRNTVAASLNIVYQGFEATGLNWFNGYTRSGTANPGGHGKDDSLGVGVKLGWTGKMTDTLTAGAFYQPKTSMDKFGAYKDLFAQDGGFDIPETYGAGVAIKASPKTVVALDVVQINYSGIKSLANRNNHNAADNPTDLGAENGKGFGWSDMTVYKLGVAHQLDSNTTIRAGWNYGKQPISADQLDFNLLAPAVVEHHFTAGLTHALDKSAEVSAHLMYAPNVKLTGTGTVGSLYMDNLQMSQYEIGFQYSKKF